MTPRLDIIEIVVEDMATSLAFYRRLGVDLPPEADSEPHVDSMVGSIRVAWDTRETIRSFDKSWQAPEGGHRMALAWRCDDPEEVDAIYRRLVDAGYHGHLEPFDAFWGQRYATLHDPDGNAVDLFCPLG
jgi:uncharacterized glyoxalase superfamily protein PhnB